MTIDQVVRATIAEAGYKNLRKYILFLHFAFDALYKLKRDNVIVAFGFISLPVVNRRALIPANVLALGQIGRQHGVRVQQFTENPRLSLDPTATPSAQFLNYYEGYYCGISYRYDRTTNEIIFERQPKDNIVYIEAILRVDAPNTETLVEDAAVLPMKAYINFRQARFKLGAASAEAKEAEREYLDEVDEAMAGLSDLSPAYLLPALLRGNGLNLGGRYGYGYGYGHWFLTP